MKKVLLIQGPDTYLPQLKSTYTNYNKVIFSSWENTNHPEHVDRMPTTVRYTPPGKPGHGNSNLQFRGIVNGVVGAITYLNCTGGDYVLKIRSDFIIPEYERLLDLLDPNKLAVLAYHNWSGGYYIDYMVGMQVNRMLAVYSKDTSDSPDFAERQLWDRIIENVPNIEVQYLLPLMKQHGISCYSLKWDRDIIESGDKDPLYSYVSNPHWGARDKIF